MSHHLPIGEETFPLIVYLVSAVIIHWIMLFSPNINGSKWANSVAAMTTLLFIGLFLLLIVNSRTPRIVTWLLVWLLLTIEIFTVIWYGYYTQ